jgi:hypothetical protein
LPPTVVYLWISAQALQPGAFGGAPTNAQRALIQDLGRARGVHFAPAFSSENRPLGLPPHDAALSDALEAELEQARTALSALEEAAASERLRRIEARLRAHPHLPQAPFLMAECFALQAQALRVSEPERAARLDAQRQALEGVRAEAFGETPIVSSAPSPSLPIELEGLAPNDALLLDGAPSSIPRQLPEGLHHVRVLRGGRPIYADFFEVSRAQPRAQLANPKVVVCSPDDLSGMWRADGKLAGPKERQVSCPSWALFREQGSGIAVAMCEAERCGPFSIWHARPSAPFQPLAATGGDGALPGWAGFTLAGAAAVLATGLVLWQSGALDRSSRSAPTWRYDGVQPQGLRF